MFETKLLCAIQMSGSTSIWKPFKCMAGSKNLFVVQFTNAFVKKKDISVFLFLNFFEVLKHNWIVHLFALPNVSKVLRKLYFNTSVKGW